jgi:hypothetical protein
MPPAFPKVSSAARGEGLLIFSVVDFRRSSASGSSVYGGAIGVEI